MKEVTLITVGKLKDPHSEALEEEYLKRLTILKLKIIELKSHSENKDIEGELIFETIHKQSKGCTPYIILLTEHTKSYDSESFSKWWCDILESRQEKIFLVIGGAEGHGEEIKKKANAHLSLSPLTFAHKLARIILIEQLYRAQTIRLKHPYHK